MENNEKKPYVKQEAKLGFPKLHKCIFLDNKTGNYIGKVHTFYFPEKGEIVAFPFEDDVTYYKVVKRMFTANTLDRSLECSVYIKQVKAPK